MLIDVRLVSSEIIFGRIRSAVRWFSVRYKLEDIHRAGETSVAERAETPGMRLIASLSGANHGDLDLWR